MNKLPPTKKLTIANFTIVAYFILIGLVNFLKVDYALIEVFREILTLPILIAQVVFLIIGVRHLMNTKKSLIFTVSVSLLAFCVILTIGSFF
jgi:hypothetical protein